MQGVENSELDYVPARQTTLLHRGARKADGGSMARTLTQIRCVQTPQHGRAHASGLCHLRTISTDAHTYVGLTISPAHKNARCMSEYFNKVHTT